MKEEEEVEEETTKEESAGQVDSSLSPSTQYKKKNFT